MTMTKPQDQPASATATFLCQRAAARVDGLRGSGVMERVQGRALPVYRWHSRLGYSHLGYSHLGYSHLGYSHSGYSHSGYSHSGYSHSGCRGGHRRCTVGAGGGENGSSSSAELCAATRAESAPEGPLSSRASSNKDVGPSPGCSPACSGGHDSGRGPKSRASRSGSAASARAAPREVLGRCGARASMRHTPIIWAVDDGASSHRNSGRKWIGQRVKRRARAGPGMAGTSAEAGLSTGVVPEIGDLHAPIRCLSSHSNEPSCRFIDRGSLPSLIHGSDCLARGMAVHAWGEPVRVRMGTVGRGAWRGVDCYINVQYVAVMNCVCRGLDSDRRIHRGAESCVLGPWQSA